MPAAHAVQTPLASLYPGKHEAALQVLSFVKLAAPVGRVHLVQELAPAAEDVPAGHAEHEAAVEPEKVLAVQLEQDEAVPPAE